LDGLHDGADFVLPLFLTDGLRLGTKFLLVNSFAACFVMGFTNPLIGRVAALRLTTGSRLAAGELSSATEPRHSR
jgi:hypothetical protein